MPSVNLQQAVDAIWHEGDYWQQTTITYSIPASSPSDSGWDSHESDGFQPINYGPTRIAAEAFELWDDLIATNLVENTTSNANITLAYTFAPHVGGPPAYTVTDAPDSDDYVIHNAKIWMNASKVDPQTVDHGTFGFTTYLHEIGHALGLSHPGNYTNDGTEHSYAADAGYAQDTRQYTVMSYFNAGADGSGADHQGSYAATPMLHDILTIQAIYGADMTTRTADTVYGFNSTANRLAFDFEHNQKPVVAIWDAGGIDTLDTSGFTQTQKIDLHAGTFSDVGGLTQNVAIAYNCDIENAIGGSGSDDIYGNGLANRLEGRDGADSFHGGGGIDTLLGGRGDDTYYVMGTEDLGDVIVENAGEGRDAVVSKLSYTLGANVEDLRLETFSGNINGTGNALDNTLTGNAGANVLTGGAGRDSLIGGAGGDTMVGGEGDDTYWVDLAGSWSYERDLSGNVTVVSSPGDQVIEYANQGFDTVFSTITYTLPDNVEGLTLEGFLAPLDGFGNGLDNVLKGNAGSNHLYGYAGADRLDGSGGADTMRGGIGNDIYVVDESGDVVIENAGEGVDTVMSGINYTLGANLENLTLTGSAVSGTGNAAANTISGNALSNMLNGGGGADILIDTKGNDTLDGGAGADVLTGGLGNDTFVFRAGQAQGDMITDFLGNGAAVGDSLQFVGFGTAAQGASFTRMDTTHYQIHSGLDGHNEIIGIAGIDKLVVHASDYLFV
jgi:serralysin